MSVCFLGKYYMERTTKWIKQKATSYISGDGFPDLTWSLPRTIEKYLLHPIIMRQRGRNERQKVTHEQNTYICINPYWSKENHLASQKANKSKNSFQSY